jgi:flagellar basal-body rod protein FlgF
MQEILSITLQSMHQDSTRLERVGMNLANALTPGYKREVVSVRPMAFSGGTEAFAGQVNSLAAQLSQSARQIKAQNLSAVQIQTDVRPGTLKSTGQSLDVAIAGMGFFEVATESGPAYTRQGNFRLDGRGRLVNVQGYPVMGKGGEIFLSTGQPSIDAEGYVFEGHKTGGASATTGAGAGRTPNQQAIAQIKVVQFDNPQNLERIGEGLVKAGEGMQIMGETSVQLRQGFLENSNVSSMHEMVQLMQTMRHFESMQRVAIGYDDMMGAAIRKLGELS